MNSRCTLFMSRNSASLTKAIVQSRKKMTIAQCTHPCHSPGRGISQPLSRRLRLLNNKFNDKLILDALRGSRVVGGIGDQAKLFVKSNWFRGDVSNSTSTRVKVNCPSGKDEIIACFAFTLKYQALLSMAVRVSQQLRLPQPHA